MAKLKINIISESAFTVQGHGVHTAYIEQLNSLRRRDDVSVVTNTDEPADIIHIHTVGPYGRKFLLHGKARQRFVSAHVVPDSFVGSLIGAQLWKPLAKLYLRWFYNKADGVCAVSHEVIDELKALGVTKPIYLTPNTIDTAQYHHTQKQRTAARKKFGITDDTFVIIANGQVQPRKRVDSFIATAHALPEMRFIWVGGIPFKRWAADYRGMTALMKSAPSNVQFTGVIDHKKVIPYYWAADVFFLPSVQETFGIVIVEGAASGLPVLLRDNNQYKKTFGEATYLAAKTDQEFADQIKSLHTNKQRYARYQHQASAIAKRYDATAGAAVFVQIYRDSLARVESA